MWSGDGFTVTIFRKVSNASRKVSNDFEKICLYLRKLKNKGLIEYVGAAKGGDWKVL